ncbi:MAG: type II toxin-antitoxin system VapC family toxin [Acidobacteria bacterium]|nr:type II toxin-antitoxin system VapC family toxin [Acidobacteriota bacterium]
MRKRRPRQPPPPVLPSDTRDVFCNTSFFYAGIDPDDVNHARALTLNRQIAQYRILQYTTWDIISETVTLLRYHCGYAESIDFIDYVVPKLLIHPVTDEGCIAALALFRRLSADKELSLCDLISYRVVTEHLNNMICLAFDDDFRSLGLTVIS